MTKTVPIPIEGLGYLVDTQCSNMCIHCGPVYSEKWRTELPKLEAATTNNRIIRAEFRTREKTPAQNLIETKTLNSKWFDTIESQTELKINGGEPFESEITLDFIEQVSNHPHAKNLDIRVYSNGKFVREEFFEMSKKFKSAKIMFSVDATGDKAEYLRWPTKWSEIENTVDQCRDRVKIGFVCTVHSLNLDSVPEIYQWIWDLNLFDKTTIPLHYKFVHKPTWLDARYVEQSTKEYINQKIWDFLGKESHKYSDHYFNNLKGCLDFLWQHKNNRKNDLLREFIIAIDKYRDTNFAKVFPELDQRI